MDREQHSVRAIDTESWPNWWLFAAKRDGQEPDMVELDGMHARLTSSQKAKVKELLWDGESCGWNTSHYDWPVVSLALAGATAAEINALSMRIVEDGLRGWQACKAADVPELMLPRHADLMQSINGMVSLKLAGARIHSRRIQDLPFPPERVLSPQDMREARKYCEVDLDILLDAWSAMEGPVRAKDSYGKPLGLKQPLMSASDSKIAEMYFRKRLGRWKPGEAGNPPWRYAPPEWLELSSPGGVAALEAVRQAEYGLDSKGAVLMPQSLRDLKVEVGGREYKLGIGGLHSREKAQMRISRPAAQIVEYDVQSYYPSIILRCGYGPRHLGEPFMRAYDRALKRRLTAKKSGDSAADRSLKIVVNSAYGKLSSKYSALYDPWMGTCVTLTGQLALLMLAEMLEREGTECLSANTDSVLCVELAGPSKAAAEWQRKTGFKLDRAERQAVAARDVNTYAAMSPDGSIKGKGAFSRDALSKNPHGQIMSDAAAQLALCGSGAREAIMECQDIRPFLFARTVRNGGVWSRDGHDGEAWLGKVCRWAWVRSGGGSIRYKLNGNLVPSSEGSAPAMDLTDSEELLERVDRERYLEEALRLYEACGGIA